MDALILAQSRILSVIEPNKFIFAGHLLHGALPVSLLLLLLSGG